MDQQLIKRIVEAALMAASQPLTPVQLQGLFPLDEPAPDGAIAQALEALQTECADRGVELVELASGWRFQVKADVHAWVARLWTERQTKYTRATLETLALIAYRQPITRGEIEQVRGVATNSNIIKALEEREWIRVVGHRDIPGRPELLGTTKGFLDYFGLKRLDGLPPLSELKDFGELDPQLRFDGKPETGTMPVGDLAIGDDGNPASDNHASVDASDARESASNTDAVADEDEDDITSAETSQDADTETVAQMDTHTDEATSDESAEIPDRNTVHDTSAHDDVDAPQDDDSSLSSNEHALAEDGDSTRSNT